MSYIIDYIDWRGDLTFEASEFNEVDNLIFTQLAYVDFNGILSSEFEEYAISIKDAWERYKLRADKPLGAILPKEIPAMFEKMAGSVRYENLKLFGYIDTVDELTEKQFSALCIRLDSKRTYVAFRGTDDTIIGWKEDFNLGFMDCVPAQEEAVTYINTVLGNVKGSVYVGGHSKGGNLAIYAAINCRKKYMDRIKRIYNNDGPGFCQKVIDGEGYKLSENKIISIVPQGSVVGQLLGHTSECIVVKSMQNGLFQHSGFSWEIIGASFVREQELSKGSQLVDSTIRGWLQDLSAKDREDFVEAIYDVAKASDAKTLTELFQDKLKFIRGFATADRKTKNAINDNMKKIFEQFYKNIVKQAKSKQNS
ncbi:MAG: DUF2974 domain-containing protein [Bacillota bacterium]|nr:DUF2974 domain-containing protein [Bacillota bacterium]